MRAMHLKWYGRFEKNQLGSDIGRSMRLQEILKIIFNIFKFYSGRMSNSVVVLLILFSNTILVFVK